MKQRAEKNDWVRVQEIILTPEERMESLPESTRKVPLKCWINGFMENDSAEIGEQVTIRTLTGRLVRGELYEVWPKYEHGFGRQQPTLIHVGNQVKELVKEVGTYE